MVVVHNSLEMAGWGLAKHHYFRLDTDGGLLRWLVRELLGLKEAFLIELVSFFISLHSLKVSLFWVGKAGTTTFPLVPLCHQGESLLFP